MTVVKKLVIMAHPLPPKVYNLFMIRDFLGVHPICPCGAMGFHQTDDIPWMSPEEMRDARLTGSFKQYVAMQEGEFPVEEPEVENWYRHGE